MKAAKHPILRRNRGHNEKEQANQTYLVILEKMTLYILKNLCLQFLIVYIADLSSKVFIVNTPSF